MIGFKQALETRLLDVCKAALGSSSGLTPYVKTFDDHLRDLPLADFPFVVAFALTKEKESGEIAKYNNWIWHCQIYYLDTTQGAETWDDGKDRRDKIMGALEKALEGNHYLTDAADTLPPLRETDSDGSVEYTMQAEITSITFDQSGQEGYYTFVSELYLDVHTAKN